METSQFHRRNLVKLFLKQGISVPPEVDNVFTIHRFNIPKLMKIFWETILPDYTRILLQRADQIANLVNDQYTKLERDHIIARDKMTGQQIVLKSISSKLKGDLTRCIDDSRIVDYETVHQLLDASANEFYGRIQKVSINSSISACNKFGLIFFTPQGNHTKIQLHLTSPYNFYFSILVYIIHFFSFFLAGDSWSVECQQ